MTEFRVHRLITRGVPASFVDCERSDRDAPIDVAAARAEHAAYVAAAGTGLDSLALDADERFPDCLFVEDTVVVLDAWAAVIARPGVASRRGEHEAVIAALGGMRLFSVKPPATLDGGDVLRVGKRLYVGLSARTNAAGAEALEQAAGAVALRVVRVPVARGLHLKSACTLASESELIYDPRVGLDLSLFEGVEPIAAPEPAGANVLALGAGRVLVSSAAPRTAELLHRRGHRVEIVDATQVHRADGGLTCCSIRIPALDAWCT